MKVDEILNEAVFNLQQDVDLLYNKAFAQIVTDIYNGTWDGEEPPDLLGSTAILTSPECIEAHAVNPVKIITSDDGNYYNPNSKYISISMNRQALGLLKDNLSVPNPMQASLDQIPNRQRKRFKSEFNSTRIKSSIYHELSHWIDDSLHNRHIKNRIQQAHEMPNKRSTKHFNQGQDDVNLSKFEINAQIHAIVQIRNDNRDIWDLYSFEDVLNHSSSLGYYRDRFKEIGKYEVWKREILKRLAREGLLGDEMHLS